MTSKDEQIQAVIQLRDSITSQPWLPLRELRKQTSVDSPARGDVWIARVSVPAPPDDGLRSALYRVIDRLKSDAHRIMPQVSATEVGMEFVGRRMSNVVDSGHDIDDLGKLEALEKDCGQDSTILFVHGGAFLFSGPSQYRVLTTRLAKSTGARVASLRHRLAPTDPWPSQLLDLLVAYANLLYPPEGSGWSAVRPEKLILMGSSSGANLCMSFIKLLLELRKDTANPDMAFHGRPIRLPLPPGVIVSSGWYDLCDGLPSNFSQNNDYVPDFPMSMRATYPSDDIWPSNPPRDHTYSHACNLDHQLISPVAVTDWSGAPTMLVTCGGEERFADCNHVLASQLAKCGVNVHYHEYEGMPHEFANYLRRLPQSAHYFELCASTCMKHIEGGSSKPNSATAWIMPDCKAQDLGSPIELSIFDHDALRRKMRHLNTLRKPYVGDGKPRM